MDGFSWRDCPQHSPRFDAESRGRLQSDRQELAEAELASGDEDLARYLRQALGVLVREAGW